MNIMTFDEFCSTYKIDVPPRFECQGLREISKLVGCPNIYYLSTFVNKSNRTQELEDLSKHINTDTFVYSYSWNKPHEKFSYYEILYCDSKNIKDILKSFKAMKLKAFI